MAVAQEDLNEFKVEADELLDECERSLLALEQGGELGSHYDSIFRVFHSLKGAASMMELTDLQAHMHQLENILTEQKSQTHLSRPYTDLFLKGADAARRLLKGEALSFEYQVRGDAAPEIPKPLAKRPSLGRVIVVDDEPEIVSILTAVLSGENYEVLGITDPLMVPAEIERFKPSVVFSDISMPKMNGVQLLAEIKKKHPDLPVVFITGEASKKALLEAIGLGVHGVIEKPFAILNVIQICGQAVRHYQSAKLITSSLNLLMYQFSDLDGFLADQGKQDVRNLIRTEMLQLIEQRRRLRLPPMES